MELEKVPFGKKRGFHVKTENDSKSGKGKRAKSQRTRVEERKSSKLKDCRINSGKGGFIVD